MARRALIVGIDQYNYIPGLKGCVNDAHAMRDLLQRHEDGTLNYACRVLTSPGQPSVTRVELRQQWEMLFENFTEDILFYFSGHGTPTQIGGFLVTQDGRSNDPGLPMNELLQLANNSRAREVLLILDCCYSGSLGNPPNLQGGSGIENQAQLREGVTILAASRPTEASLEFGGHGVFTWLVLAALSGGAADVRGRVSAASVYAYVEQALGPWEQRPLYKSHANCLSPIRCCKPAVSDVLLRELPIFFPTPESYYIPNPTYEKSHPTAIPENVAKYQKFIQYRDARLLRTVSGNDLYFTVMESKPVQLTLLGQFYWHLAKEDRI
jgi:hypothetical protein